MIVLEGSLRAFKKKTDKEDQIRGSAVNGTKIRPFGMFFLPRRGCRIQPRVSTLGNIQEKRFALKGREITWAKCVRLLPKREEGIC